jgi:serine/threonine protein kinase
VIFWGSQIAKRPGGGARSGNRSPGYQAGEPDAAPDGYIKVLDFGLGRNAGAGLGEGELAGTLGYMSPEAILQRPITAASDIFSLGIVLYELASGTVHPDFTRRIGTYAD